MFTTVMTSRSELTSVEVDFVLAQRVGHLATADAAGTPHVVPVCYAFDGRRFYIALDEKPKRVAARELRRVRNIEVRPQVSLVIDRYEDDWTRLGYVLIEGHAVLVALDDPVHAPALRLLRDRYLQYLTMDLENRPVIAVTPDRVVSWGSL